MRHGLGRFLSITLRVAALVLLAITLLPILDTDQWWVRSLEFPRVQLIVLISLVMAGFAVWERKRSWIWLGITFVAFGYQVFRVWPFTPLHPVQSVEAESCPAGSELTLMASNVLQTNRDYDRTLDLVRKERPDLFLALETDLPWVEQLDALKDEMSYGRTVPIDNTYGMALYSRLPLDQVEVRYTVEPDAPSMAFGVTLPSGSHSRIYALHPRPPIPGKDSGTRDAELVLAGLEVKDEDEPVIVFGDLNDVAWSPTTRLFQQLSGLLDPRVGRGFYNSFNAKLPLLRWPLDHVFHSEHFTLLRFAVLPATGSDHFPVLAQFCLDPAEGMAEQAAPQPDAGDLENAEEQLEDGLEQQREEMAEGEDETDTPEPD